MNRSPAVAGQFYPGQAAPLRALLDRYCPTPGTEGRVTGVISPHAGYLYSGAIAGKLFARVSVPEKVILLGPNHHGAGHPGALYSTGGWETPLGHIDIDQELAARILERCRHLAPDAVAHRHEHSLEVQVPFIQHCNPSARLVPICIGRMPLASLIETGEGLADVIAADADPILIIASSDMTHFESAEAARTKDLQALQCVEKLDAEGLFATVRDNRISMCGVLPSVVMLAAARKLGAEKGELIAYGTSGDITGDNSNVVGYAAVIVQ